MLIYYISRNAMAEFGLVHSDLNPTNWSISQDYKFCMLDFPGGGDVEYRKDWNLVAHEFLSLLVNLPDDFVAAFRFGCIQYGGKVAELMFGKLRDDYQMHGFRNCQGLRYESNQPTEGPAPPDELLRSYQEWSGLRESLPAGLLCGSDRFKPAVRRVEEISKREKTTTQSRS